jgi:hypothetical protein
VRRRGRSSRPSSRVEAGQTARQRRIERMNRPPSWRGAVNRAAIAAAVFLAVLVLLLSQSFSSSLAIAALMFLVYIPMGYGMDAFIYRMRQRKRRPEGEQGE